MILCECVRVMTVKDVRQNLVSCACSTVIRLPVSIVISALISAYKWVFSAAECPSFVTNDIFVYWCQLSDRLQERGATLSERGRTRGDWAIMQYAEKAITYRPVGHCTLDRYIGRARRAITLKHRTERMRLR